jgi:hypothetical protein
MIFDAIKKLLRQPLFSRNRVPERPWDVISWWESRRIPYNIIVGAAGIASGLIILITAYVTEHMIGVAIGLPDPPIFAIIAAVLYGVMANLCFTGGWILELLIRRIWGERTDAFGEIAFTWGTLGSVILTLLPAVVIALAGIYSIVTHG